MRRRIVPHRVPVLLLSSDGTVLCLNEAARGLLDGGRLACGGPGWSDELGRTLDELLRPDAGAVAAVVPLPGAAAEPPRPSPSPSARPRAVAARARWRC